MNAFCNTDDITWGTKNLDTKRDATEAKGLMKSGLVYNANQVGRRRGVRLAWGCLMRLRWLWAAAARCPGRRALAGDERTSARGLLSHLPGERVSPLTPSLPHPP